MKYFLESCDKYRFRVDPELVELCPTIKYVILGERRSFQNSLGGSVFCIEGQHAILRKEGRILATLIEKSKDQIVVALPELSHTTLDMLIDYCNFMLSEDARDENKREAFEARFLAPDTDQAMLCELASASYYLDFRPLVNLTSRIIAAHISGKSPQQLRAALGFDTLEAPEAPRHDRGSVVKRLHKRLEQKHRDGSRELGVGSPVQSHSTPAAPWPAADALASIPAPSTSTIGTASNRNASDERSLEELLSFIEDGSDDKKKKKRRGKKKTKRIKKDEGEGSEALHLEPDVATENLHHPAEDASDPDDAPSLGVGPAVVDSATLSGRHVASMRESQDETSPATATDAGPEQPPMRVMPDPEVSERLAQELAQPLQARREQALQKLAAIDPSQVEWASEDEEDDDFDLEVEGFRRRLEAADFGLLSLPDHKGLLAS